MALDSADGYVAGDLDGATDASLPIFNVERVQLQFNIAADFVAAQVANNVLIVALATGRILRIDLDNAADIDGTLHRRVVTEYVLTHLRCRPPP
jgi:vacuolar protein sorting-associated protein 18